MSKYKLDLSKLMRFGIVCLVLLVCTANVSNSFFTKWGFRENTSYAGLASVIDGTAYQPYVYRSAVPRLVDNAVSHIKPDTQANIYKKILHSDELRSHFFSGVSDEAWTARLAIDYHIMYMLIIACFLVTLIYLRKIYLHFKEGYTGSLLAIILFSLMYPLLFTKGAYFYDFFELLGITISTYYFLKNKKLFASIILILTAFNKETAFVAAFGFLFLHEKDYPLNKRLFYFALQLSACLFVRHLIIAPFASNPDTMLHLNLLRNLGYWVNPIHYLKLVDNFAIGIYVPAIHNVFIISWLAIWIKMGWQNLSSPLKAYALGIFIPNLLLFITFGNQDEFRNMSLSLIALFIILIHGFSAFTSWLDGANKKTHI